MTSLPNQGYIWPGYIWITRPEAQARGTRDKLKALGFKGLMGPLLIEEARPFALPAKVDGIILTSQNAAKYLSPHAHAGTLSTSIPVYCVGERTARAAQEAGFMNSEALAQDAEGLIAALRAHGLAGQHLFYPAADAPRHDLAASLAADGITIHTAPVYHMEPVRALPPSVLVEPIRAVLLYSPFTAKTLVSLLPAARAASMRFLCLSDAVAAELPASFDRAVASAPTEDALLQLLGA